MAIVSISEAARLTGKARSTLQAQIKAGKLSKTTDDKTQTVGIDTSELIRVFGELSTTQIGSSENVATSQQTTSIATHLAGIEKEELKAEIKRLNSVLEEKEKIVEAKQETINSLNNAMRLLEDKRSKVELTRKEEPKKGFIKRFFRIS